jgi:hypothetical protein
MSIEGTNYVSGLAIGGSSGNLLWKGNIVPTLSAATVGSNVKPVWVNDKSIVASNATVGGDLKPAYLKAGTITETQYTMAALEVDQTFTGTNTFNKKISASGGIDVLGKASIDTNGYVIGTWLQMTAENTRAASAAAEICIKQNGWIYTRTPSEIL